MDFSANGNDRMLAGCSLKVQLLHARLAILTYLSDDERRRVLGSEPLPAFTVHSSTDLSDFSQTLIDV